MLSSISIVKHCLSHGIKTFIITGHSLGDLGIYIKELEKIGFKKSHILKKPATIGGYDKFLETIEKAII